MKDINLIGEPRLMESKDLPQVYALYKKQIEKSRVSFKFSQQELGHHLMPQKGVIYTLVFENTAEKKITDFVSFYSLPSQILKQTNHNHTSMNVSIQNQTPSSYLFYISLFRYSHYLTFSNNFLGCISLLLWYLSQQTDRNYEICVAICSRFGA